VFDDLTASGHYNQITRFPLRPALYRGGPALATVSCFSLHVRMLWAERELGLARQETSCVPFKLPKPAARRNASMLHISRLISAELYLALPAGPPRTPT